MPNQHSPARWAYLLVLPMILGNLLSTAMFAQDLDDDEQLEFLPGLIAEYRTGESSVVRLDSDLQFQWDTQLPDQRLPPGRPAANNHFSARWTGLLQIRDNGLFQLRLFACGKLRVTLAGKQVLSSESTTPQWFDCQPLEMRFGQHELQVEFEKTVAPAQLSLFWSGPGFSVEPVASRYFFHPAGQTPSDSFHLGQALSRSLRCAACHNLGAEFATDITPLAAPALTHLQDNLRPNWLVARLTNGPGSDAGDSRMPHFDMHPNDAAAISAALLAASAKSPVPDAIEPQLHAANKSRGKKDPPIRTSADLHQGRLTFVSTGCLACHQIDQLGQPHTVESQLYESQLYGGGDLSDLTRKRTPDFLARWLQDPAQINASHRMPIFELSLHERLDLAAYLNTLGSPDSDNDTRAVGDAARGVGLIQRYRCGACHELPQALTGQLTKSPVTPTSDWNAGCLTAPRWQDALPGYGLDPAQRDALREYYTGSKQNLRELANGPQLLAENNCLACHSRDQHAGLKAQLADLAQTVPDVSSRLAAIAPPSLTGVGDKLHERALRAAITREAPALRTWLDVRMPKYNLDEQQLDSLVNHLIAHDRVPELPGAVLELPGDKATELAAARLVTAEGFGCQSCHKIGAGEPPKVDLNARGTDLTMLGDRIRPSWFQRWVRNPARIVPRMEMPAIQTAVKGVLSDSLDLQLEALWRTLNTPGYQPPRANPVRVVRTHNLPELQERAHLLTDVIETTEHTYLRPLVFGLPNRHNLLFDLEAGQLATWWIGDAGHQHTRGKSWYWEPGAKLMVENSGALERISLVDSSGLQWLPATHGQVATKLDQVSHVPNGIQWQGRLYMTSKSNGQSRWIGIRQVVYAAQKGFHAETQCLTELSDLQPGERVVLSTAAEIKGQPTQINSHWQIEGQLTDSQLQLTSLHRLTRLSNQQLELSFSSKPGETVKSIAWNSNYRSLLDTDQFPSVEIPSVVHPARAVEVVPGYEGIQLPLPPTEMPISFAWGKDGSFYAGSLKGRVLELKDYDQDGLPETYEVISDEFPTPFGLHVHEEGVDALAKFALLRLAHPTEGQTVRSATVLADGWGYTADYHDWAVGLERDADGNYYLALPCQQDDRSEAAAHLRGHALKLVPYESSEEPRSYRIEPFAAGLRFPMGIALNEDRDLFTTDNQGNYNPFNELNHLRFGKRYGFINKLDNKDGFSPPFESPAINLPHPWTRSVNGMCFLKTPVELTASEGSRFGPFEGHLIGCEMNGRSLVRMSLQKVGSTYQGAAYMFSRPVRDGELTFEGPITCKVSPAGDLYVGSLQDSGWSGGQNSGSIVRLRPTGVLPLGMAEVRGTATGFEIDFTGPINPQLAVDVANYSIRSYQRISTPAYGGEDQDEKNESIKSIQVAGDAHQVRLDLHDLRAGFVYELNIADIGLEGEPLFPAQAHYTMRAIPDSR